MVEDLADRVTLFICSFASGSLFCTCLQFLKMFIYSKPPGRRLVTADIHIWHASSYQALIIIFTAANMYRAITISRYVTLITNIQCKCISNFF